MSAGTARFFRAVVVCTDHRGECCATRGSVRMKIKNSLKSLMARDRNNKLVRRRGRVYIINKKAPRYKARQG